MKKRLLTSSGNKNITNLKCNAFTLIELLAIIVILAIIAVITVPIILNIIENSRKGAITDSAYGYKDAVNKYYLTELSDNHNLVLNGQYDVLTGGVLNGSGIANKEILVSGDKPSAGELHYTNNTLQGGCLVIGEYEVVFEGGSVSNTQKGDCTDYVFDDSGQTVGTWDKWYYLNNYNMLSTLNFDDIQESFWIRENTTTGDREVCGAFPNGDVCLKPGNYSETICDESYNCTATGYLKDKLDEMESKGGTYCNVDDGGIGCIYNDSLYESCSLRYTGPNEWTASCGGSSSCSVRNDGYYDCI